MLQHPTVGNDKHGSMALCGIHVGKALLLLSTIDSLLCDEPRSRPSSSRHLLCKQIDIIP
jgi:hypothetical protein